MFSLSPTITITLSWRAYDEDDDIPFVSDVDETEAAGILKYVLHGRVIAGKGDAKLLSTEGAPPLKALFKCS